MKAKSWILVLGLALLAVVVVASSSISSLVSAQGANGYGPGDGSGPVGGGAYGQRTGTASTPATPVTGTNRTGGYGYGMGGMMGGGYGNGNGIGGYDNSLVAVAADKLGMTSDELIAALGGTKSIAQVASEHNVAVSTIVDTFLAPRAERMDQMVSAGRITREQADQMLATMRDNVTEQVNEVWAPQGPGDGDGVCDYMGNGGMGPNAGTGPNGHMGRFGGGNR